MDQLIYPRLLWTCLMLIMYATGFSQLDSAIQNQVHYDSIEIKYDSARIKLFNQIKELGKSEQTRNRHEYHEDTIAAGQEETIGLIRKLTLEAQAYLDNGIDTTGLGEEMDKVHYWYDLTKDGVFINVGSMQTHRNLETSYKIMRELLIRVSARKLSVDEYYKKLIGFRNTIDSLYQLDVLYSFSSDSAVLMRYAAKLALVSQEIKPIDSALKKTIFNVAELQPPINMLVNKLNASIERIQFFQSDLASKSFRRETNAMWAPVRFSRPFNEILNVSLVKAALSFAFYVQNELEKIIFIFILVGILSLFLVNLKRNLRRQNLLVEKSREQAIVRYPFLSALFIVLNIFQFVFIDPPFLFSVLIWTLSGLSLIFILKNIVVRNWMFAWLLMFVLFLVVCFDNLILQASRPERWMMLALSIAGIVACSTIILRGLRMELKEKTLYFFVGLAVIMQIASMVANLYGHYNLSKTSLTAGTLNVVLAVLFFWTLYLTNQGFALSAKAYDRPNRKLFNINFERTSGERPLIFYILLFTGWFIMFGRNFYAFSFISEPIKNFITEDRKIGAYTFSIGMLVGFFFILYVSGVISRMVSFFASSDATEHIEGDRKGIGSWILIVRIFIITVGLLLAFAVVGIPMDRLTIILSALSVGVGFGLQSLVNNLVSGLIISFERPLRVGDMVEIDKQSGIVKSIGFRSSIIRTPDGANVVIPNGDLLNRHLVNWTQENPSRAVAITVGVRYGTDLEQVTRILKALPEQEERILAIPAPGVAIRQFNENSIEVKLSFWVKHLSQSEEIKSNIMLAIDRAFKANGIMTFPQLEK